MFNGPVFNNETIQANARAVNAGGISENLDEANALYSRLSGASFKLVPSSFGRGVLYSGAPGVNGDLTWTRASDAWRTNADGLIQRVPWNLIPNSQVFSGWQKVTVGTTVTVTDNAITAPNGTMTAARVVFSTFSTSAQIYQAIPSPSAGVFTTSIYAKVPSGTKQILFGFFDGTIKTQTRTLTTEWQRIEYSTTLVSFGSSRTCWLYGDDGTSNVEIHIWGGQHVEGSSSQTYFPTTDRLNVPRLSYMYGSCPAVLLEPQRTNLALYSEQFATANSYSFRQATVSNNTTETTAPDGTTNADKIFPDSSTNLHQIFSNDSPNTISFTSGTTYTQTVFAKLGNGSQGQRLQMLFSSGRFTSLPYANFNLQSGTVTATGGSGTATITALSNGWYRCSITATCNSTGNGGGVFMGLITTDTAIREESFAGNTSHFIYAWGAQMELGAYPTTYIPTTTASATRVADSFSRNNIYTNGLITSSGGTWFVELRGNLGYTRDGASSGLYLDTNANGQSTGIAFLAPSSGGRMRIWKVTSGSFATLYNTTTDTTKIAIKWNGTTADVFANGTKVVSATSFTATNMEYIGARIQDVPYFIQAMALYPTPLSDTDCTTLTTL